MLKRYLLAPGPTPVPPEVLLAMARPMIHHRAPEFDPIFAEVREGLKWLFQTRNDVLMLASSGTGGMEGSVSNFLSPGEKALCINGGKFGERWGKLCKTFGVQATELKVEWGHAVDPQQVADALKKDPSIKAVYVQASETSTGVSHDVRTLGEIVKGYENTILVVDAITALGVFDIKTDAWGLDVVITGSQKALMLPPGMAFVSVSDKAWALADKAKNAAFYFNFKKERENIFRKELAARGQADRSVLLFQQSFPAKRFDPFTKTRINFFEFSGPDSFAQTQCHGKGFGLFFRFGEPLFLIRRPVSGAAFFQITV